MGKDTTYSMNTITITVTDGELLSAQGRLRMLMLTGLRTGPESVPRNGYSSFDSGFQLPGRRHNKIPKNPQGPIWACTYVRREQNVKRGSLRVSFTLPGVHPLFSLARRRRRHSSSRDDKRWEFLRV